MKIHPLQAHLKRESHKPHGHSATARDQIALRYADLPNGERLAYRTCGEGGTAVVLLHGNLSSSAHWESTMKALAPYHRVIAPDLRGFGDSSYHSRFSSLGELAQDVLSLLECLHIGQFAIVGWSAGGGVAMEMAAEAGKAVTRLVLVAPVPPTGYPVYSNDMRSKEGIAADPVHVQPLLRVLQQGDREAMRAIWNGSSYSMHQPDAETYEAHLTASLQERCLIDLTYALINFDITQHGTGRISKVTQPLYILHGERDRIVPTAWIERMAQDFGNKGERISFVKAGHSPMTDQPTLFLNTLTWILTPGKTH